MVVVDIILMEPEHAGNVGAIARAMGNFGLKKLVLIDPKCDHLSGEAIARSKHAKQVLKNAKVMKKDFFSKYHTVIGTTAQVGNDYNLPRSPLLPEELAQRLEEISGRKKIGLLFGREGEGLHNDEIQQCDFIVTIPSHVKYPTLNLSHAACVMFYELFRKREGKEAKKKFTIADDKEKKQLMSMFTEVFSLIAFSTSSKKKTQEKLWKRIMGKSFLTKREAYGVMGFLKKVREGLKR